MKIVQVLPSLSPGDAIGDNTLALEAAIRERGYETRIYADSLAPGIPEGAASPMSEFCRLAEDDVIILHVAIASRLNKWIRGQKCRKVMVYHNITPPRFFTEYSAEAAEGCRRGLEETRELAGEFGMVLAVSGYNRRDLLSMGFEEPVGVLPILVSFGKYRKAPSERILRQFGGDGYTNIVFVGRIAPNKKQEDVIRAFADYQRYYNPKSRLFIVGNAAGFENYDLRLKDYVKALGVRDVLFTGHVAFDEILAYYSLADLFLCQSEHEGFCVPLVEAMYLDVPIVAYDSSAVGETLGGAGFLLKEKDSVETAAVMNRVLTDGRLRQDMLDNQRERVADFQCDRVKALFWKYMDGFIGG